MSQLFSEYRSLRVSQKIFGILLLTVLIAISYLYFQNAKRANPVGDFSTYADDAYIHLRFAHHIASGEGIVWNIGEAPVEGSTSFLYLLMIASIEMLGIQPIWILPYISVLSSILLLVNTFILLQVLNRNNLPINLTVTVMFSLFPPIMTWSISGLEVMLYAFAILFCTTLYILYRKNIVPSYAVGFVFAITAFIRPECLLLFIATILYEVGTTYFSKDQKYKPCFILGVSFLSIYLPVFLWKWNYFGYPFPNTYYAKTGGGMIQLLGGIDYLKTQLIENFIPAGLLGALYLATIKKDEFFFEKLYVLFLLLASWGIVVINGGDYMGTARFLTPTISLLYILGSIGITVILSRFKKSILQFSFLGILLILAYVDWRSTAPILEDLSQQSFPNATIGYKPKYTITTPEFVMVGKVLKDVAETGQSIALVPIGAIGYYSELTVYDMVGLVDVTIAHEPFAEEYILNSWTPGHDKGNGSYILSLNPTYILLNGSLTFEPINGISEWEMQFKSIIEIWGSEQFHENYVFCPLKTKNWYINLYCHKSIMP